MATIRPFADRIVVKRFAAVDAGYRASQVGDFPSPNVQTVPNPVSSEPRSLQTNLDSSGQWPSSQRETLQDRSSAGGIVIPETAHRGTVISIGEGRTSWTLHGKLETMRIKVGDEVIFSSNYTGTELRVDGEDLIVMNQDDVLAIVGA